MPYNHVDHIEYRYHAVGQGLFASGAIIEGGEGPLLRWVYDCGTVSGKHLIDRELDQLPWLPWVCTRRPKTGIELVTISHFDADHISGFAILLSRYAVDTLLLPYMPLATRLILAFEQGIGADDRRFWLFIDPIGYITSLDGGKNIRRIVMVPPANGESAPPPPEGPDEPPPAEGAEPSFELNIDKDHLDAESLGDPTMNSPSGSGPSIYMLAPGGRLYIDQVWEFVPYNDGAAQPSDLIEFRNEVENQKFALSDAAAQMRNGSGTSTELKAALNRLKAIYDQHFGKGAKARNIISLFLYSGPLFETAEPYFDVDYPSRLAGSSSADRMGQLFTGDGYLDNSVRLDAMANHFGRVRLDRVGIFQVMHHGAAKNWHDGVAERIKPDVSVFCSEPLRTNPGHPHAEVLRNFWPYGAVRVDCDRGLSIKFYRYR